MDRDLSRHSGTRDLVVGMVAGAAITVGLEVAFRRSAHHETPIHPSQPRLEPRENVVFTSSEDPKFDSPPYGTYL